MYWVELYTQSTYKNNIKIILKVTINFRRKKHGKNWINIVKYPYQKKIIDYICYIRIKYIDKITFMVIAFNGINTTISEILAASGKYL